MKAPSEAARHRAPALYPHPSLISLISLLILI